jgi:anaerobic selenocysteine-containing dehydrogenase
MRVTRLLGVAIGCVVLLAAGPAGMIGEDLPWASWFEKNTTVSDKGGYVHMMWDANAVRSRFEGKGERAFIAEAARQLALLRYPKSSSADQVRADIVFVTQRDEYGNPKWDTLQRVAHVEFSRKLVLGASGADLEKSFQKFEIFR